MLTPIVGCSEWAQTTRRHVARVAKHPATVLITGPSGTGKELIARSIHTQSTRSEAPFVPVDCASATGSLFASQLFGHDKGAFTGATHPSLGIFRAAEGGTVFLDEVGELEPELQGKLLRVLQERVVVPLGGTQPIPVDIRVIAATNRDLTEEVQERRFREDLYFRLNVVPIRTQPLAMRREDIRPLAENFFLRQQVRHGIPPKRISAAAMRCLERYSWPGNVRELENVLERCAIFCDGRTINVGDLPEKIVPDADEPTSVLHACTEHDTLPHFTDLDDEYVADDSPLFNADVSDSGDHWPRMAEVEREHLLRTLGRTGYNQSLASRLLGVHRNALRRMAQRLDVGLSPPAANSSVSLTRPPHARQRVD